MSLKATLIQNSADWTAKKKSYFVTTLKLAGGNKGPQSGQFYYHILVYAMHNMDDILNSSLDWSVVVVVAFSESPPAWRKSEGWMVSKAAVYTRGQLLPGGGFTTISAD